MQVFRYLAVSIDSIFAHKLRAGLTMLGIIIGIAAVLITVGIGSGAAASITDRIEASGTHRLLLQAHSPHSRPRSLGTMRRNVYTSVCCRSVRCSEIVSHGSQTALSSLPVMPSLTADARNTARAAPRSSGAPPCSF